MILLILLLYLSYLHVAKNKINTQYRNIDARRPTKICSAQTPPPLRPDAAFAPTKKRPRSFGCEEAGTSLCVTEGFFCYTDPS